MPTDVLTCEICYNCDKRQGPKTSPHRRRHMPSDEKCEDKNIGPMTMPWPMKIVFCWFVLLAVGSIIQLVAVLWCWSLEGEAYLLPVCIEGLLALSVTVCYIYATCHGPRRWITLSYPVLGSVLAVAAFFVTGFFDVVLMFVLATVVPMWLLYRPSAVGSYTGIARLRLTWGVSAW